MPRRIEQDWKQYRNVIGGKIRKELKRLFRTGEFTAKRGKNGKIGIQVKKIDSPFITYGESPEGVHRGKGEKGDVIGRDPESGEGNEAGQGSDQGHTIMVDLEDIVRFMKNELELPNLKPKNSEIFDEIKIRYNNISLKGPESLRHNRRTFLQALKRQAAEGTANKLHVVPGLENPVPLILPINEDKRYRQYKEIKIPSSNALIVFARDGSGSMDDRKCKIVSDMAWWIDLWIRSFYKRTERLFVWHDSDAQEVDENTFYNFQGGGGTECSSALKFISKQFENRYPPEKWNIYVFYFTDGENWTADNQIFIDTLQEKFQGHIVNFVGITQIMSYLYSNSIKELVDGAISNGVLDGRVIRTAEIGSGNGTFTDETRNEQIMQAIRTLMGAVGQMENKNDV